MIGMSPFQSVKEHRFSLPDNHSLPLQYGKLTTSPFSGQQRAAVKAQMTAVYHADLGVLIDVPALAAETLFWLRREQQPAPVCDILQVAQKGPHQYDAQQNDQGDQKDVELFLL